MTAKSRTKKTGKKKPGTKMPGTKKPWGGRFTMPTDILVEQFTQSVSFDQRLCHYDIMGSIAHACMLAHTGIISKKEAKQIVEGLESIEKSIEKGEFHWDPALEDVHMNIEQALIDRIGETGKKLHTGRSRNDQVATDLRLYLRNEVRELHGNLCQLMEKLLVLAGQEADTLMPGFTHLQNAQPVTFGHHMLAWFEMLYRDAQRLQDCQQRINVLPLGSGALAGTGFPINRAHTAKILGFSGVSENSLDAVSDRDFVIEFCHCAALIMMHLSRFSEELILWSSQQFGFITLDDAWCTGSSIMPQKKNPDIPELVRGKAGRVYGNLMALLTLMKAQPLAYNRDNQEDKLSVFDTVDTVKACVQVYTGMVPAISVNRARLLEAAQTGCMTATDLADYLTRKKVPFRDAHEIVGKAVQYALKNKRELPELTLEELRRFSDRIEADVFKLLGVQGSVASRNHIGGTAPGQVRAAIQRGYDRLHAITVK